MLGTHYNQYISYSDLRPRESTEKEPSTHSSSVTIKLDAADKRKLYSMLESSATGIPSTTTLSLTIPGAFPAFVEVPSGGEVQPVKALLDRHGISLFLKSLD